MELIVEKLSFLTVHSWPSAKEGDLVIKCPLNCPYWWKHSCFFHFFQTFLIPFVNDNRSCINEEFKWGCTERYEALLVFLQTLGQMYVFYMLNWCFVVVFLCCIYPFTYLVSEIKFKKCKSDGITRKYPCKMNAINNLNLDLKKLFSLSP